MTDETVQITLPEPELAGVEVQPQSEAVAPQPADVEVQDSTVTFVPFEDFDGRVNQTDFHFREGIPTKVSKAESNVWIEAKKGYIK